MLVAINGLVYNSEDEKISLLLFKNEIAPISKALRAGDNIISLVPKGTPQQDIEENMQALTAVDNALRK